MIKGKNAIQKNQKTTEETKEKIKTNKKIKLDEKNFKLVTEYRMVDDMTRDNTNNRKWHTYIKMQKNSRLALELDIVQNQIDKVSYRVGKLIVNLRL